MSGTLTVLLAAGGDYLNGTNGSPEPLSTAELIGIFLGIPLAVAAVFALLTIPSRAVGALRYRPGRAWAYGQEHFGVQPGTDKARVAVPGAGGASARW